VRIRFVLLALSILVPAEVPAAEASSSEAGEREEAEEGTVADSAGVATAAEEPAQRDAMDVLGRLFGRRVEPSLERESRVGVSWSLLPSLSYNPVYGFALGASLTGSGKTGAGPYSRPTFASLSGNYSTTGQVQALARGESSTPSGLYLLSADFRYLDTSRSTWGLGSISPGQEEYPMSFRQYRAYATLYRRTSGPVYVGLGYRYDEFSRIRDDRAEQGEITPFLDYSGPGVTRTRASSVSVDFLADTRDNLGNPSSGYLLKWSFRSHLRALGSDENWQELWVTARVYPHVPKRSNRILAFWLYGWFTFGPGPYLNLPATGWDTYGRGARGYLAGRIRAQDQIYLESEYRVPLTRDGLFGGVVFVNGTISTSPVSQVFESTDYGGGVGIRIKFNKAARTNLALDRAWGRLGSGGWFMGLAEVF
jgi:hypothetical protein